MIRTLASSTLLFVVLTLAGCDSEEPSDGAGEEELITRVSLVLVSGSGETTTAVADDPDGDGVDVTVDTLVLQTGAVYSGRVAFEDAVNGVNITEEVKDEGNEHQVFYEFDDGLASRITLVVADEDRNGLPVGLEFALQVTSRSAATGTLNVVLSHYDDGPKDGATKSSETDVDIVFPVWIVTASPQ